MGANPPGPTRLSLQDARDRVRAGEAFEVVVSNFVAGLSLNEKPAWLDGDEDFWPGLRRMAGSGRARVAGEGYGARPYYAAVLPDVGFPGYRVLRRAARRRGRA